MQCYYNSSKTQSTKIQVKIDLVNPVKKKVVSEFAKQDFSKLKKCEHNFGTMGTRGMDSGIS
jgi:hypothetical protein